MCLEGFKVRYFRKVGYNNIPVFDSIWEESVSKSFSSDAELIEYKKSIEFLKKGRNKINNKKIRNKKVNTSCYSAFQDGGEPGPNPLFNQNWHRLWDYLLFLFCKKQVQDLTIS